MIQAKLDKDFYPMYLAYLDFKKKVEESNHSNTISIAILRNDNQVYSKDFLVYEDGHNDYENILMVERIIKTLLWIVGGYKIFISNSKTLYQVISTFYQKNNLRSFDNAFMSNVYENNFEVIYCDKIPNNYQKEIITANSNNGKRIGFDAGGSDIKITALDNKKVIYSEEIIWYPKDNSDASYHINMIKNTLKKAMNYLNNEVDAIGISSAGIYINNKTMVASLFLKVNEEDYKKYIKNIYPDIIKSLEEEFNQKIPFCIANDGDVSAFLGYLSYNKTELLGVAMGTSEAGGYINKSGNLLGWLNELAFVPIAYNKNARIDEWSLDYGVGAKYLCQEAVIDLAKDIDLKDFNSLALKLKYVQTLLEKNDKRAIDIFETIGVYFGYAVAYYSLFYDLKNVLLLGRVVSLKSGEIILRKAQEVLKYHNLDINIILPDEKYRRVGQAQAAAFLIK